MQIYNKKSTKIKRRILTKEMTLEENILWEHLRRDALGVRFRRQYGIGEYIADFYCPKLKLVIELDGEHHYTKEGMEYDKLRESFMENLEIKTIRFKNREIREELETVLIKLENEISNKK